MEVWGVARSRESWALVCSSRPGSQSKPGVPWESHPEFLLPGNGVYIFGPGLVLAKQGEAKTMMLWIAQASAAPFLSGNAWVTAAEGVLWEAVCFKGGVSKPAACFSPHCSFGFPVRFGVMLPGPKAGGRVI